ncbi:MAG: hypothetical protein ACTMIR_00780 [Cellulomonadaceae bacterium]
MNSEQAPDLGAIKTNLAITAAQAGEILGLGRHPIERLKRAAYITPTLGEAERLASRPVVSGGVPVLRLGDPTWDGERRIGHARHDNDRILEAASLGWWGGPIDTVCATGWLVASVSGFAIGLFRIDGVADTFDDDGYERTLLSGALAARVYDLVNPQIKVVDHSLEEVAETVLGNRVPNPRGAPIVIV